MVIELQMGMKIMGLLICFYSLFAFFSPFIVLSAGLLLDGLALLAISLIAVYSGILWFKWLQNDNAETRKGTVIACALQIVANLISAVWTLINSLFFVHGGFVMQFFIAHVMNFIIMMLFSFYFYTVARRYAVKHGD